MNVIIEPKYLLQFHNDETFIQLLESIPRKQQPQGVDGTVLPRASGRALRGMLLNTPHVIPDCGTETFEVVARQYTPSKIHDAYYAFVWGDEEAWGGLRREIAPLATVFQNRRVPLESVIALLYVLQTMRIQWILPGAALSWVDWTLGELAHAILRAVTVIRGHNAKLNPLRYTYIRSFVEEGHPDEICAVVDAYIYRQYLAEGHSEQRLIEKAVLAANQSAHVRRIRRPANF